MTHQHAVETLAAERYVLDEMPEIERYGFEEHFFECEQCAEELRLYQALRADSKRVFDPAPSRSERTAADRPSWWQQPWRAAIPWAAAAVLAIALGIQVRSPGQTGTAEVARVYEPVALRPASRGAVPTVPLPEKGHDIALALDVNIGAPGDAITYTLAREPGNAVDRGRATVPPSGIPLVMVVPADRLEPDGAYVLILTAGDPAIPSAEYRFTTAAR